MRAAGSDVYRVLGDQPFDREGDSFGFGGLAGELTTLILASRPSTPFTIGIEASWGRGKSTLMAQLARRLHEQAAAEGVDVRTVSFNAWTAEGEDVLEGLVKSVLEAMDTNVLRRALRRQRLVSAVKIPLLLAAGWLQVGGLVNEAWDRLSADAHTRNQVNDLVRDAMQDWFERARATTSGVGPTRLLVVFIDDLDRCSPDNVLKVFEGMKLYLDAPGFVFVVGYDEGIVSEAVADRKQYSARATGRDYVEKVVQIVFRIPEPTETEVSGLLDGYLADSGTTDLFDESARRLVIERNGRNPRRIKRFVNRFILDYRLDEASQDLDAELLIRLLIFETYFPEFARLLTAAAEKNPLQEFLEFAAARDFLRRGVTGQPEIATAFESYGLAPGDGEPAQLLEQLEREAPEVFVELVRQEDFVSLVRSLDDPEQQELVLAKVQRRHERAATVQDVDGAKIAPPPSATEAGASALAGRRILWVDDRPENNEAFAALLRSAGAEVALARDREEAVARLSSGPPELLISDVGRGLLGSDGFADVRELRAAGLYAGPVVFFTARVSATAREQARALGAEITSDPKQLLDLVATRLAAEAPLPT